MDALRWKVRQVLENAKPSKSKIMKLAISTLQKNENIIMSKADKGNAAIVIDISEYKGELEDLIRNISYNKERSNKVTERKLAQVNMAIQMRTI